MKEKLAALKIRIRRLDTQAAEILAAGELTAKQKRHLAALAAEVNKLADKATAMSGQRGGLYF